MKSVLRILVSVLTLGICVSLFAGPSGDNLENLKWDAKKVPPMNEPPLKTTVAEEWRAASEKKPSEDCSKHEVWKTMPTSKVAVTVMKEIKTPVKGGFDHFTGYFFTDPKTGAVSGGQGQVDLSSWDSHLEARDRRIQRYVFDVETAGKDVATVSFVFGKNFAFPKQGATSTGEVDVDVAMEGSHFKMNFPVKASRTSPKGVQLVTLQDASFTYATDEMKPRILKMMEICNHHFISSFVHVGWNLTLENTCAKH
jgi:hypothetical protein